MTPSERELLPCKIDLSLMWITLLFYFLCSTKQTQDDEKSVERAHRELVKLDQQMGVSVAQFTEVSLNVMREICMSL